jgi:hypothetical protein
MELKERCGCGITVLYGLCTAELKKKRKMWVIAAWNCSCSMLSTELATSLS